MEEQYHMVNQYISFKDSVSYNINLGSKKDLKVLEEQFVLEFIPQSFYSVPLRAVQKAKQQKVDGQFNVIIKLFFISIHFAKGDIHVEKENKPKRTKKSQQTGNVHMRKH